VVEAGQAEARRQPTNPPLPASAPDGRQSSPVRQQAGKTVVGGFMGPLRMTPWLAYSAPQVPVRPYAAEQTGQASRRILG
jgi:hypothetical protein